MVKQLALKVHIKPYILIFFPQVTDFLTGSKAVACKMKLVPLQTSFSDKLK